MAEIQRQSGYNKSIRSDVINGGFILEQHANDYDGISYYLVHPSEINQLGSRAKILLEPGQIEFFSHYPKSLDGLIDKAAGVSDVPNFAKWLASLRGIPVALEVHTTSDMYDLSAVWLRFHIQDRDKAAGQHWWKPAINLLSFLNPDHYPIPGVLLDVFRVTGEINHNGYMVAGRLRHPDRFGDEYTFYEAETGDKAFYQDPDMSVFWSFHGGYYETDEERRKYGLYQFEEGMAEFLDLYFACLLDKKELWIERDGSVA